MSPYRFEQAISHNRRVLRDCPMSYRVSAYSPEAAAAKGLALWEENGGNPRLYESDSDECLVRCLDTGEEHFFKVDDVLPQKGVPVEDKPRPALIAGTKGFQMTFKNGNTVSVQFGPGNYCENRDDPYDAPTKAVERHEKYECTDAEVAAWRYLRPGETLRYSDGTPKNEDRAWHKFGAYEEVRGWLSPYEVAEFISFVANNELNTEIKEVDDE